jgi:hypothetical protein
MVFYEDMFCPCCRMALRKSPVGREERENMRLLRQISGK